MSSKQPQSKDKKQRTKDKYYILAKEHGYRARSAYKLVQLEKKYGFLGSARIIIDLCAAPGGWCQVARKYAPVSSAIVGCDLLAIPSISGVKTLVSDITNIPETLKGLKNALGGAIKDWGGVDVVLNDGAPSMGTSWLQDAYSQLGLALAALQLAANTLAKGGWFITKAFRSSDYNALYWVCSQFFTKVEATKPQASRNVSAEMYLVCRGFLAPAKIDPRLFDATHVFASLSDTVTDKDVLSTKYHKALAGKRKIRERGGYDESFTGALHVTGSVLEFIDSNEPGIVLGKCNKVAFIPKSESNLHRVYDCAASKTSGGMVTDDEWIKVYRAHERTTPEVLALLDDIKLLSKGELARLERWRSKMLVVKRLLLEQRMKEARSELEELEKQDDGEELENVSDSDEELAEELTLAQRRARRGKRKRLEAKRKLRDRIASGMKILGDLPLNEGEIETIGLFQMSKPVQEDDGLEAAVLSGAGANAGLSKALRGSLSVLRAREQKIQGRKNRGLKNKVPVDSVVQHNSDEEWDGDSDDAEESDEEEDAADSDEGADRLASDLDLMYEQFLDSRKLKAVEQRISTLKKRAKWMQLTGAVGGEQEVADSAYVKGAVAAAGDVFKTVEGEQRREKSRTRSAAMWYSRESFAGVDVDAAHVDGVDDLDDEDEVSAGVEGFDVDEDMSEEGIDEFRVLKDDADGVRDLEDRAAFKEERRAKREAKMALQKDPNKTHFSTVATNQDLDAETVYSKLNSQKVQPTRKRKGDAAAAGDAGEEDEEASGDAELLQNGSDEDDDDTLSDSEDSQDDASDLSEERARVFAVAHAAVNKRRKRSELRDQAFSRYAYADDVNALPGWFIDDEAERLKDPLQVSQDEVKSAREFYNRSLVRGTITKAAEAAFRKKRKVSKRLKALKDQATDVALDGDVDAAEKAVEMKAMLKTAKRLTKGVTQKREKAYVVTTKQGAQKVISSGTKGARMKSVDRRLLADKRNTRRKKAANQAKGGAKKGRKK